MCSKLSWSLNDITVYSGKPPACDMRALEHQKAPERIEIATQLELSDSHTKSAMRGYRTCARAGKHL